jgi:aryl-alcohol dehydrogenase-like predicted oxidoreductase
MSDHHASAPESEPRPEPETVTATDSGTWKLGELTVNRIGFGAMRLSGRAAFHDGPSRDRAASIAVLRRAVELGVNHIDTAAFYFSALRSANEIINSALGPYPDDLVIATKVGPRRDRAGAWSQPARPDELRGDVEENLRQLGRDHLDLVYLRRMGEESIAEHFGALAALRDAGLIRQLGVSNVSVAQLKEAQAIAPVTSVQNRYGLGRRGADDLLHYCGEQAIAFVPFFAIAGARTSQAAADSDEPEHPTVLEIATTHGLSPSQIRLTWTLHQGLHVLAIPGTGDPQHLVENIAAGAVRLSDAELAALAAVPAEPQTPNA